jgi:ATP-dependent DNA helicase RecQ
MFSTLVAISVRLAEIFIRESTPALKSAVLKHFMEKETTTRIVICTEAFGMGVDCPDIEQVIHLGVSATAEDYIQQTGRSGRDGRQARALLVPINAKHTEKSMQEYHKVKGCRRQYLFSSCMDIHYDSSEQCVTLCKCCSNCARSCECGSCVDLNSVV